MASKDYEDRVQFLANMSKKPMGKETNLTFGDAQIINSYSPKRTADLSQTSDEEIEEERKGFWASVGNFFGTIDELANKFGYGFVKTFEGIGDAFIGIAGGIGTLFGASDEWAKKAIQYDVAQKAADWTETFGNFTPWGYAKLVKNVIQSEDRGQILGNFALGQLLGPAGALVGMGISDKELEEWKEEYNYSHDFLDKKTGWFGQLATGVASAAGQLVAQYMMKDALGSIAGAVADKMGYGAEAVNTATEIASYTSLGLSSAGGGTEEALNEGATLGQALAFGALTGATEVGTEMIGGYGLDFESGLAGKLVNATAAGSKIMKTVGGKILSGFLSEGFEELMSDMVSPIWKNITYDPELNLGEEYKSVDFWVGAGTSFLIGGLLGGIGASFEGIRANNTTVNGKKVGIEGYDLINETNNLISDYQSKAKRATRYLDRLADKYDIKIDGNTEDIRVATQNILNNENLTDSERTRAKRMVDLAVSSMNNTETALENFESTMQNRFNVNEEDIYREFNRASKKALQGIAASRGQTIGNNVTSEFTLNNYSVENFVDRDGIHVSENTTETGRQDYLSSVQYVSETSSSLLERIDTLMDEQTQARYNQLFQDEQLRTSGQVKPIRNIEYSTQLNQRIAVVNLITMNNPQILETEVGRELFEQAVNESSTIEEARNALNELVRANEERIAQAQRDQQALQDRLVRTINSDNAELVQTNESNRLANRYSRLGETLSMQFLDDARPIYNALVASGMTRNQAQIVIDRAKSQLHIGSNISQNGFFVLGEYIDTSDVTITREMQVIRFNMPKLYDLLSRKTHVSVDEINKIYQTYMSSKATAEQKEVYKRIKQTIDSVVKGKKSQITRTTRGIYNGTDGIVDQLQNLAKKRGIDFEQLNAIMQEKLVLQRMLDNNTLGNYLTTNQIKGKLLNDVKANFELLTSAIENNVILTEADFNNMMNDEASRHNGELTKEQTKIISQVRSMLTQLTNEQMQQRISEIDKSYPEFNEIANQVYEISRELLNIRLDNGLITREDYDNISKKYKHYVPTYREMLHAKGFGSNLVPQTIQRAKGSDLVIRDIFTSLQSQIYQVEKAIAENNLAVELANSASKFKARHGEGAVNHWVTLQTEAQDVYIDTLENTPLTITQPQLDGNTLRYFENGNRRSMFVSDNVAESFQSINGSLQTVVDRVPGAKSIAKIASIVRNTMTSWNPFFSWFRNPIKDLQNAILFTKNKTTTLLKNWSKALTQVAQHSYLFETYLEYGGSFSNMANSQIYEELAQSDNKRAIRRALNKVAEINEIMENTTRFAEFISTYERLSANPSYTNEQVIQEAIRDAHEITLNFSRKGTVAKVINRYVPFLTANIEAAARNVRAVIAPKSAKEWASAIIKMLILGIAPQILQEIIYRDDDDYQSLSDTMKSNYYLIKVGKKFIRLPKGYVQQAFGSCVVAVQNIEKGENAWEEIKQAAKTSWQSVGVDISGVFFQPILDAKNNVTWYGGQIVSAKYDNVRPGEQYDRSTSWFAKKLGKLLNISPLKIDYVLDQMTGVVGDILIPLTSEEGYNPLSFLEDQFITDPIYKNKYAGDFYDYKELVSYDKTDGDVIATIQFSYLTRAANEINELRKKQEEIRASELSNKEKDEQDSIIQIMINQCFKTAIDNAKKLGKELENYELSESSIEQDKLMAIRASLGSETAISIYNSKVYSRAQMLNRVGLSYDEFFVYYFNARNMEDRDAVERYIANLRVKGQIKNLLYKALGFRLNDEEARYLTTWLKRKGLSEEEIEILI